LAIRSVTFIINSRGLEDTYEFYGGLSYDTILSPSITWYYDADAVEGSYVAFGLGHSVDEIAKLSDDISMGMMDIGLNIGWGDSDYNDAYWSGADAGDGFNDLTLSFAFPIPIGSWTVSPSLNYMTKKNPKSFDMNLRGQCNEL
jgi:hypothetical protein